MKRELKKFFRRKSSIAFLYVIIVLFCLNSLKITIAVTKTNSLDMYLDPYDNSEQLKSNYEALKSSYSENKNDYETMGLSLQPIRDCMSVYEYVIENYIDAEDGVMYFQTFGDSRDAFCVFMSINDTIYIVMLLVIVFLSASLFSGDFSEKRHRFLYSGTDRIKILKEKLCTYLILVAGFYVMLQILSIIYTLLFSVPINTVLIVNNGNVIGINIVILWFLEFFSLLLCLLPYVILFFFIGVLTRNEIISGLISAGVFLLVRMISNYSQYAPLNTLGNRGLYTYAFGMNKMSEWIVVNGIWDILILLFAFVSVSSFRKARL